ncbi:class I SAM-dependent methyltransferase [Phytoactinopolyspora limicola]|uniref:class I SAM-dependent methyltransferase n=1 Tax=Phytoactinopolyspora limicola TaxID=2715536 RepID=UPI00140E91AD|nr:class I SAM-dependent methyltransferase [Phytoactinopolyspora limicola]
MPPAIPTDASFLAPGDGIADWRLVLAYEAAADAGVLDRLPATLEQLAGDDLDVGAVRAVLGVLEAWDVVRCDGQVYAPGTAAPKPPDDEVLIRHGATIRRWAGLIGPRLRDRQASLDSLGTPRPPRQDLLARNAQRITGSLIDRCLEAVPGCRNVLDLGGGHGIHALELARRGIAVTLQDLPPVVDAAQRDGTLTAAGVSLFAADLRTDLATGPFDLVLCSGVTNMFDARANQDLFHRVRPLLASDGACAVVSFMRGRNEAAASFALQMLVWTDGGDAHAAADYQYWFQQAGFNQIHTHELDELPQTLVLARCPSRWGVAGLDVED